MATESPTPLLDTRLLGELERCWRAQRAPLLSRLRPGLSGAEIDEATADLGLRLPLEARVWWGWHDSATPAVPGEVVELGPGFQYFSLAQAVRTYETQREIAVKTSANPQVADLAELGSPDYWWRPSWFPITHTGYGGVVACDCSAVEGHATPIRIVDWKSKEDFYEPVAQSFGQMVTWWIEALDTGAWYFESERGLWQYRYELLDPARELSRLV